MLLLLPVQLLFDLAERVFLVLAQVRVLRHDPLDQDRQHERPLVLEAPQLVERRVADLKWRGKSMQCLSFPLAIIFQGCWVSISVASTHLDEIFQRFDVLGLLLWVVALLGFVRQRLFRDHLPHVGVPDGRHEVIFDVILGANISAKRW